MGKLAPSVARTRVLLSCCLALWLAHCGKDQQSPVVAGSDVSATGGIGGSGGSTGNTGGGLATGSSGAAAAAGGVMGGQGGWPLPQCPRFAESSTVGAVAFPDVIEASGLAASRKNADVLWVHNDSGDSARLFALTTAGTHLGVFRVTGATARDWEDMAPGLGPDSAQHYLYVGDFGDNSEARPNVVVYRVPEPTVASGGPPVTQDVSGDAIVLQYPGGSAHNAETLLADPLTKDLFIVTKKASGVSEVYRASAPHAADTPTDLVRVASITFGVAPLAGGSLTTAGDVSPDGTLVIIRTYGSAYLWRRNPNRPLHDAFETEPCEVPLVSEPQGEALAFAADGRGYYTVSEGQSQPLYFFTQLP